MDELEARWAPTLGHITTPEVHTGPELPAEPIFDNARLQAILDKWPAEEIAKLRARAAADAAIKAQLDSGQITPDVVLGATADVPSSQLDTGSGGYRPSVTLNGGNLYWGNGFTTSPNMPNTWTTPGSHYFQVSDRTMPLHVPEPAQTEKEQAKAFVSDVGGKTIITAPATTIAAMKEPTVEDITSEHMLWMHGKFVGAEAPNRNGAFWSAGDLEMAQGTVTNGPLNWLHDARHVIGTLAKAEYVNPRPQTSLQQVADTTQPHITATAAIWKWIYPEEAYVIQQASDQEMLWYSMECISKEVSCVGEGGCGNTVSYTDYMAGAACEHIIQRASVRRFKDPVFLGGAVIVPPTRPGWAEADARVMVSDSMAEAAFEQAGQPDMKATEWEGLMAQVIKFARA